MHILQVFMFSGGDCKYIRWLAIWWCNKKHFRIDLFKFKFVTVCLRIVEECEWPFHPHAFANDMFAFPAKYTERSIELEKQL